jgi:transcriptional regulator with XRE-family HTH domain
VSHANLRLGVERLYLALDRQRRTRRITWRQVAAEVGVSASTFTRIGLGGRRPDVDALVRILAWLGTTDLAPYIATDPEGQQP